MKRLACFALVACLPPMLQAQTLASVEPHEWSAFVQPEGDPAREVPHSDLSFQDIKHEGPWSRQAQAQLSADARQLLALLQQQSWGAALALLKERHPDLNRSDDTRLTPLSLAARAGQAELVREMIRQGAALDQVGAGGMTPLGAAAYFGHDVVVRELLRKGARPDVPGLTGQLPLHLASAAGHVRVVKLLMQHGADWREPNRQGRHALAEAALFGKVPVMQALLDAGANPAEPDLNLLNAVHAAALGEQMPALDWLRQQGVAVPSVLTQVLIDQLRNPVPR